MRSDRFSARAQFLGHENWCLRCVAGHAWMRQALSINSPGRLDAAFLPPDVGMQGSGLRKLGFTASGSLRDNWTFKKELYG
jgi:hypothetical protein